MINRVVLVGRLTTDPELKTTDSGKKVCNFTIAINDGYGDKQKSYFIACVVWNKSAENLAQYTKKGDLIGVEGKLTQRTFDLNGSIRSVTEVLCSSVTFLNSTNTKTSPTDNDSDYMNKYSTEPKTNVSKPKNNVRQENSNYYQQSFMDNPEYISPYDDQPDNENNEFIPYPEVKNKKPTIKDEDDLPF